MKPPLVSSAASSRWSAAHRGLLTTAYDPFTHAAAADRLAVVTGLVHADVAAHTRTHPVLLARAILLCPLVLT